MNKAEQKIVDTLRNIYNDYLEDWFSDNALLLIYRDNGSDKKKAEEAIDTRLEDWRSKRAV